MIQSYVHDGEFEMSSRREKSNFSRPTGIRQRPGVDLLRKGERDVINATDLPPMGDDEALATWIHAHPRALQRPIAVNNGNGKVVVGRPPENVLDLLPL